MKKLQGIRCIVESNDSDAEKIARIRDILNFKHSKKSKKGYDRNKAIKKGLAPPLGW